MEPPSHESGEPVSPLASSGWEGPLPPRPDIEEPTPPVERHRRRWIVVGIVVLGTAIVAGTIALLQRDRVPGLPESVGGFRLVRGEVAEQMQKTIDAMMPDEVRVHIGMYGDEIDPQVIVFHFERGFEISDGTPLDAVLEGAASNIAGAPFGGASVDLTAETQAFEGGTDYLCAPIRSTSVLAPYDGVLCLWRGDSVGLVVSFHASDPSSVLDQTKTVAEAIDG